VEVPVSHSREAKTAIAVVSGAQRVRSRPVLTKVVALVEPIDNVPCSVRRQTVLNSGVVVGAGLGVTEGVGSNGEGDGVGVASICTQASIDS